MENFLEILSQCSLFHGIDQSDLNSMIGCLDGKTMDVPKGNPIFFEGAPARFVGIVLSGTVQVVREDYLGVERSAMSAEIGKLKNSDQTDTRGPWFCIKHAKNEIII